MQTGQVQLKARRVGDGGDRSGNLTRRSIGSLLAEGRSRQADVMQSIQAARSKVESTLSQKKEARKNQFGTSGRDPAKYQARLNQS